VCVESTYIYPRMKMEQTDCSETSAYKIQTPGNYPEENIQNYPPPSRPPQRRRIFSLSSFFMLID
jgi:hypothetical protein